ncbi:hypothetical protein [Oceanirhabdus seepicola]|uniref:DUF4309 domain-containing protein n=1 Tax=Oceanirhabdus seepicola TaxID=2828781 RepID=A0A9J6NVQ6_9CLOT|nr:hypothetical protein [Oceanirhabdus seepicola]MCM1988562.1 hypothetical protein [Oceanirhabdus seepicola]
MKKSIRIILATACIIGLVGCGANNTTNSKSSENQNVEQKENSNNTKNLNDENKENQTSDNNYETYLKLIGLNKEELISTLEEEPSPIDEDGLEFSAAEIRVWFDINGQDSVSQIFTQNKEIDFNGVKIGAKISDFKNIFGEPIEEDRSSAYSNFKYNDIVLSVYYNSETQETFSIYILNNSKP